MIRCCFIIFILWVSECIISQPLHDAEDPNFPLNFALNITGFNATTFNISSAVLPNNTIPFSINQTYINSSYTFYNATIKEYPAFNFSAINITMVNQTYSEYPSFNSTMFNATLFNQTVFDHTIFNNTIFNSTFFNSTMFNNTMINDTMFNFFNYTMFNYTMLNSTMFNHTMFNYTVLEHPIYNISNSSVPVKSPAQSDLPSPLPSLSPVVESHYRLWIYSELYSSPVCATSSAEYAFGVSSESCVSQSPFFLTFFSLYHPLVKSFKIEGTDCSSTRLRLYKDPTCDENDAMPRHLEDELWDSIVSIFGQCNPDFSDVRYTEPRHHSRLLCVPIVEDKVPTLNFDSFVASGYPNYYGVDLQESCLDVVPSTFAAIPSEQCNINISPFLYPSFPSLLTTPQSAYEFQCANAEALGIATEYEYLNSNTCEGIGRTTKIPLNVCAQEQVLNPGESKPRKSPHPMGRRLQEEEEYEENEFETSVFVNLAGYQNATMLNISIYGELNITTMENMTYFIPTSNLTIMENNTHFAYSNISNFNAENITLFNNITQYSNITLFTNISNFNNITNYNNITYFTNFTQSNITNLNLFNFTVMENITYFQNITLYANETYPEPEFNYTQVFNYTMFNNITANITMFENSTYYSNLTQYYYVSDHHEGNVTKNLYYYVKYSCVKGNQTNAASPVASPTVIPTRTPTRIRTRTPSVLPKHRPSVLPTYRPSVAPTYQPSAKPTANPSFIPSVVPSMKTSATPTVKPIFAPSVIPTWMPTAFPTEEPSFEPFEIESTFTPTEEPTLKEGETRAPKPPPTRAPSAAPTFQTFPVITFDSERSMTLDSASVSSLQSGSGTLVKIMCSTQLKSQGLGSESGCSLSVTSPEASRRTLSANMLSGLASLLGFSTGVEGGNFFNHFRGAATNTPVKIDFISEVNMVNYQDVSVATMQVQIVQTSQTFSPSDFKSTLTKEAQSSGIKVAVTGVSTSVVAANSFVIAEPPTFSPTVIPTTATPNIAPSATPTTRQTSTASPSTTTTTTTTAPPSLQPSAGASSGGGESSKGGGGSSESGLGIGAIIGIAVGAFVLVILVAVGVAYYIRNGNKLKVYAEQ